jgi:hypothetical protein
MCDAKCYDREPQKTDGTTSKIAGPIEMYKPTKFGTLLHAHTETINAQGATCGW